MQIPRTPSRRSGFTLVEVLMVIMIIGVLTGLVLGIAGFASKKSAISKSEALHRQILFGLENFRSEWGQYPQIAGQTNSADDQANFRNMFRMLYLDPRNDGNPNTLPFIEINDADVQNNTIVDSWANSFRYRCPGLKNKDSFDLYSIGPDLRSYQDGLQYTEDDIKNW